MATYFNNHIGAEIIAASVNEVNTSRITTFKIRIPRIILSEFNTHRVMSRNFASSRAIPSWKIRKEVLENPFVPVYWGANQRGMSASNELTGWRKSLTKFAWLTASKLAVMMHWTMEKCGLHKQTCNRIVEPWLSIHGTVTSTEWENFFRLRLAEDAQPEMRRLAECMKAEMEKSTPRVLKKDEPHLPWIDDEEREQFDMPTLVKISVARCCRTSYDNMLGAKSKPMEDAKLATTLSTNGHLSPWEHVAFVPSIGRISKEDHVRYQRNFRGWYQLRAFIEPEHNEKLLKHYKFEI